MNNNNENIDSVEVGEKEEEITSPEKASLRLLMEIHNDCPDVPALPREENGPYFFQPVDAESFYFDPESWNASKQLNEDTKYWVIGPKNVFIINVPANTWLSDEKKQSIITEVEDAVNPESVNDRKLSLQEHSISDGAKVTQLYLDTINSNAPRILNTFRYLQDAYEKGEPMARQLYWNKKHPVGEVN